MRGFTSQDAAPVFAAPACGEAGRRPAGSFDFFNRSATEPARKVLV
jgi:hypothetical protein